MSDTLRLHPCTSGAVQGVEEVQLVAVADIEQEIKVRRDFERRTGGSDAYGSDSDEEGMPRGQRVSCAQQ